MISYFILKFKSLFYWCYERPKKLFKEYNYYHNCKKSIEIKKTLNELHIYVIAFNNEVVIELLITKLKEFLDNSFTIVVFDNSNNFKKRPLIKNSCKKFDVNYFSLPKQPKEFLLSESHGLALNYVYRNFVQKVKPPFFGFLDHDVFPFQKVNIVEILKIQEFYGIRNFATHEGNLSVLSSRTPEYWYLWPGFCFFKFSFISKFKKISFMPLCENNLSFDTGGFLYK